MALLNRALFTKVSSRMRCRALMGLALAWGISACSSAPDLPSGWEDAVEIPVTVSECDAASEREKDD